MRNRKNDELLTFTWCMCVLGLAAILAACVISVCVRYGSCTGTDEAPDQVVETTEVEQEIDGEYTMESSAVSGSAAPSKPVLRHEDQLSAEYDEPQLKFIGTFIITAYCPCQKCCGKWADGITSTGTKATQGRTIAVDPRVIPYGTVLYFEGHTGMIGGYIAEDCGSGIKENRIDLYFESHAEALKWGVKVKDVYIIE